MPVKREELEKKALFMDYRDRFNDFDPSKMGQQSVYDIIDQANNSIKVPNEPMSMKR